MKIFAALSKVSSFFGFRKRTQENCSENHDAISPYEEKELFGTVDNILDKIEQTINDKQWTGNAVDKNVFSKEKEELASTACKTVATIHSLSDYLTQCKEELDDVSKSLISKMISIDEQDSGDLKLQIEGTSKEISLTCEGHQSVEEAEPQQSVCQSAPTFFINCEAHDSMVDTEFCDFQVHSYINSGAVSLVCENKFDSKVLPHDRSFEIPLFSDKRQHSLTTDNIVGITNIKNCDTGSAITSTEQENVSFLGADESFVLEGMDTVLGISNQSDDKENVSSVKVVTCDTLPAIYNQEKECSPPINDEKRRKNDENMFPSHFEALVEHKQPCSPMTKQMLDIIEKPILPNFGLEYPFSPYSKKIRKRKREKKVSSDVVNYDEKEVRFKRVMFTKLEEEYIVEGVKKFGTGNWKTILNSYPFHETRSNVNIKDKYRTMLRKGLFINESEKP